MHFAEIVEDILLEVKSKSKTVLKIMKIMK